MFGNVAIRKALNAVFAVINPKVAPEIENALQHAQFLSVRRQVPMLLLIAGLNAIIIMAMCAHNNIPFRFYSWITLVLLYCVFRIVFWQRRLTKIISNQDVPKLLRMCIRAALTILTILGAGATYTYVTGLFNSQLLIPISLGFGSLTIAHCLHTMRPIAIGAVVLGIIPTSTAMILVGDFDAVLHGIAMLSVAVLMIRFVSEQYNQLILSLHLERQIRELANTDPLTGLANRRAIMEQLDTALEAYQAEGKHFGVALLDLDGFKAVNDELGHNAGDIMLQKVAERLSAAANTGDTVGRLGGDEFIILMHGVAHDNEISARATAMMAALCQPVEISSKRLTIAASLGFAHFPQNGQDIDAMLHFADTALYTAKRQNSGERRQSDVTMNSMRFVRKS